MNSVDSLLIKANRLPQIKFNGLMMYAPIIHDYGYSEAITNGANLISVLSASQSIFNNKSIESQYRKIGLQNQSLSNSSRITEKDLKKAITEQYLTAYSFSSEMTSLKTIVKSSHDEEAILKQMMEKGIYRQTDYLSFLVELQSQELDLNDLELKYKKELSGLKLLCGMEDTNSWQLSMPEITHHLGKTDHSPFFSRFMIDSLSIQNEKTIIDRNYKPSVSWLTDAGLVNNEPVVIYKNFGISIGMSLTLPVYDGNQRKMNYQKLKMSEETRKGYADFFRQQYDQQLQQLNEQLLRIMDIVPKLKHQLEMAEVIVRQDKDLLNQGGITIIDYVLALKNLMIFRKNLNQYQVDALRIINEINYWEE
jgi:outer membrane protein TolC